MNLTANALPPEISDIAASLEEQCGAVPPRMALAAQIVREFEACGDFKEEYRRRQLLLGKAVNVHRGKEVFPATAEDIDDDCAIILRLENGEIMALSSGEVSLRLREE